MTSTRLTLTTAQLAVILDGLHDIRAVYIDENLGHRVYIVDECLNLVRDALSSQEPEDNP